MAQYSKELKSMLFKTLSRVHRIEMKYKSGRRQTVMDVVDVSIMLHLNNSMTIKMLSERTLYTREEILKRLNKYIKYGLVEKQPSKSDKRQGEYHLTLEGIRYSEKALSRSAKPMDFAAQELTTKEEKAVLKYLSRLHQAFRTLE